jgi:hypothetical protein
MRAWCTCEHRIFLTQKNEVVDSAAPVDWLLAHGQRVAVELRTRGALPVDALTLFGLCVVTLMLVFYALEHRSAWYILGFAVACAMGSAYGFLQCAWPFGLVEAVWALVALRRWRLSANRMR